MQRDFLVEIKSRDFGATLDSTDIFYYLNKAQENWIKEKYQKGFEIDQSLTDDLRVFVVKDRELDTKYSGEAINGFYVDYVNLPDDYLHRISDRSKVLYSFDEITFTVNVDSRVPNEDTKSGIYFNKYSQSDDIYKLLSDPFNKTKHSSPLIDINDSRINIYTDNRFLVDKVFLNYIREPLTIDPKKDQACELPNIYHKEIVEQAVALFGQFSQNQKQKE